MLRVLLGIEARQGSRYTVKRRTNLTNGDIAERLGELQLKCTKSRQWRKFNALDLEKDCGQQRINVQLASKYSV